MIPLFPGLAWRAIFVSACCSCGMSAAALWPLPCSARGGSNTDD